MSEKVLKQENKMGVMPVNKLLIGMSLPMMISMLVQALYNIVDSIFVAQISENALTAVSLAFPMQTLMVAIGIGTVVGVNAVLSKALGSKDFDRVNVCATNGVFLAVCSYFLFLILGLTVVKPFYYGQSDDTEIVELGIEYLTIALTFSFGVFMQFVFERLLTSTGRTVYPMITQMTGAIINIILDPIMIFGWCGMPAMGIKGAAIATVTGQIIAAILAIIFNHFKNPEVHIRLKGFKPDGHMILDIYKVGIPSIVMQSIGSVMTFLFNKLLGEFSNTAVALFGVYFKLQSFIFMPVFGLNGGMVPIVAYNYGAGKRDRMMKTWKLGIVYAVAIMTIGTIVFEVIPEILLSPFNPSSDMIAIGVPALRIIGVHFPIAAFCIVTGTLFQSLGKSVYSMITSIMRQIVVLMPAAYLLSMLGDVTYVWWSFPIAEVMSAVATVYFFILLYKKIISKVGEK